MKNKRNKKNKALAIGLASLVGLSAIITVSPMTPFNVLAAETPLEITPFTKISAGGSVSLAILPDKTVVGWGLNTSGQLGDGTTTNKSVPTPVVGLTNVVSVHTSGNSSYAITEDGKVYGWGSNYMNPIHAGAFSAVVEPRLIPELEGAKYITSWDNSHAVIKEDGSVWTWGANKLGRLGGVANADVSTPTKVVGLEDIVAFEFSSNMSIALKSDGTLLALGYGTIANGLLATGTTNFTPVQVPDFSGGVAIDGRGSIPVIVNNKGDVYQWINKTNTPVIKEGLSDVVSLESRSNTYTNIALKNDGLLYTWSTPDGEVTKVPLAQDIVFYTGDKHHLAQTSDGSIYSWGDNTQGQLGRTGDATAPFLMTGFKAEMPNIPSEPPTPEEDKFSLWNPSSYGQLFVNTLVPSVTVMGGQKVTSIKLNGFEYNITEPIETDLGSITLTSDGSGNTILSIPDGLGTSATSEHLDVMYNGTNILDIEIKAKPTINFTF